jgi:hypothetical protein
MSYSNVKIFSVLVILYLIARTDVVAQNLDCYFVNDSPGFFNQDSIRKVKANKIIENQRDLIVQDDTLTLIGLSKIEILNDLNYMVNNPNSTRLNDSGYYCGIVVVLNWMLNNVPDEYAKAVIDLTFYGETRFPGGSKVVRLPQTLAKNVDFTMIPGNDSVKRTDIGNISVSDFVLGVSLVYSEKVIQRFGLLWKKSTHRKSTVGNFLFANTMPWEVNDYFKIVGIRNITKGYYQFFKDQEKILAQITSAVDSGKMPILMENHLLTADRHKNLFYKIFGAHFISIHDFEVNYECNTISISYWDYGSVKNHREQSKKGSPLAARSLNAAIRRNNRLNKIKKRINFLKFPWTSFSKVSKDIGYPIKVLPATHRAIQEKNLQFNNKIIC